MSIISFFISKRKNYFISPRFQLKYSLLIACLGALVAVVTGCIIIAYLNQAMAFFSMPAFANLPTLQEMLERKLSHTIISLGGLLLIQFILFLIVGLYITHRICGPIFVLERNLRKIIKGIYSEKMVIRKKDEFQAIPKVFNRMVDKLQSKVQEDIAFLSLVETELEELEQQKKLSKETIENLSKIKTQARILKEQRSYSLK
jgi:methyl-accepting chemotaxis protein